MKAEKDLLVVGNLAKDVVFGDVQMGGCAASIAVNSNKLGLQTGIMSVLGTDNFSLQYRQFLSQSGIDVSLVSDCLETLPVCEVTSTDNLISSSTWYDNGCHPAMDLMPINREKMREYSLVHLVSCPPKLARRISEVPSLRLSYEPGPMLTIDTSYFDPIVRDKSGLVFFNQEEFDIVLKSLNTNNPADVVKDDGRVVVVTRGKQGSDIYYTEKGILKTDHVDAFLSDEVIDHTGAGDCYKSGFFAAYLKGKGLVDACKVGAMAGKLCVSQKGGFLSDESLLQIKNEI
jgi:sugar/nucleoside kinase (ribokinase family)